MSATPDPDRLRQLLESAWAGSDVPGVVAGIMVDGELAWWQGIGRADLDRPEPPDADSLSRVASITKPFTGTAIMQLRDAGRLSLDDPIERHLPELAALQERDGARRADVTIRRVLTHRSGLVTESPLVRWSDPRFPSRDELLAAIPDTAVVIPADSAMKYSNLGFGLLGHVVERIDGRPFPTYLRDEILGPLGMGASAFEPDARGVARRMTGYTPQEGEDRPAVAPVIPLAGQEACGQLQSSVRDLARWLAFQCREDGGPRGGSQVLAGRTLAEMHRPLFAEPDWSAGHALAWRIVRVGDRAYHTHGGGIHGYASSVAFNLPARVGAIVLANSWPSAMPAHLSLRLLEALLGDQGRPVLPPVPGVPPRRAGDPPPSAAPAGLRPFLGRYRAEPAVVLRLEWRAGALRLLPDAPDALPLHAPALLEPVADGPERTFRVANGRGAGESVVLTDAGDGPRFSLGGFDYRRVG